MITFFNVYLTLNVLFMMLFLGFKFLNIKSGTKLKFFYGALLFSLICAGLQPLMPSHDYMNSSIRVWAAPSHHTSTSFIRELPTPVISFTQKGQTEISVSTFSTVMMSVMGLLFLGAFILITREMRLLKRIRDNALLLKKQGKTFVLINDQILVPFSFWTPGHFYSVFPSSILSHPKDFSIALSHELQHHRQGDTQWVFLIFFLRSFCFWNPFIHLLARDIGENQEFACDEALLETKNIGLAPYAGCLLRVAETAVTYKFSPVCAAGFCFSKGRHILKRRIDMMKSTKKPLNRLVLGALMMSVMAMISIASYGSRNLVQDRRITMEEAQSMAEKAAKDTEFPIVVNDLVLEQLNKFLGTPEGREYFKKSLERKKAYEGILASTTQALGTPDELNAIPITESAYQNLPSRFSVKAAGLWMFIPGTARKYGMVVKPGVDERLNVSKETDAAHRYLLSNKLVFNDWLLALFAYNVGEGRVANGIRKYKTRDVWELSKHIKGDTDYLQKVMASIIIMKNPELLSN